jgi:hypothetical protein
MARRLPSWPINLPTISLTSSFFGRQLAMVLSAIYLDPDNHLMAARLDHLVALLGRRCRGTAPLSRSAEIWTGQAAFGMGMGWGGCVQRRLPRKSAGRTSPLLSKTRASSLSWPSPPSLYKLLPAVVVAMAVPSNHQDVPLGPEPNSLPLCCRAAVCAAITLLRPPLSLPRRLMAWIKISRGGWRRG